MEIEIREGLMMEPSPIDSEEVLIPLGGAADFMIMLPPRILQMVQGILDEWMMEEMIKREQEKEDYPLWISGLY